MGSPFGIGGSDSTTNAPQTGATGSGRNLTGKESNYLESGSLQIGKGGKLNLAGTVDLSGSKGSTVKANATGVTDFSGSAGGKILGGADYSGVTGGVTISSSDPTVTRDAINSLAALSSQFGQSLTDFAKSSGEQNASTLASTTAALSANAQTLSQAISSIGQGQQASADAAAAAAVNSADNLAASNATGGITSLFTTKPAVMIALAVIVVIGLVFWKRK